MCLPEEWNAHTQKEKKITVVCRIYERDKHMQANAAYKAIR